MTLTTELTITAEDGVELAAEICRPRRPRAALTLAHPHPLYGGDRDAPLIARLAEELPAHGIAVCRWNFRGVDPSRGTHDEGRSERLDVAAALDVMAELAVPLWAAGWSFGADVSLSTTRPDLAGWIGIAPPLRYLTEPAPAAEAAAPTWLLVPAHDQFRSPASAREATTDWVGTEIEVIEGADHFLTGAASRVLERIVELTG